MFGIVDLTSWLTPFGNLSYVQGIDQTHSDNRRPANIASSRRNNLTTGERAAATEPLPQIPQMEVRTGVRFHESIRKPTDAPKWTVEFSARIDSSKKDVATSLGELPSQSFVVLDVRSYWQVNDKLLLSAGGGELQRQAVPGPPGPDLGEPARGRPAVPPGDELLLRESADVLNH